jgi:hypothetical protein
VWDSGGTVEVDEVGETEVLHPFIRTNKNDCLAVSTFVPCARHMLCSALHHVWHEWRAGLQEVPTICQPSRVSELSSDAITLPFSMTGYIVPCFSDFRLYNQANFRGARMCSAPQEGLKDWLAENVFRSATFCVLFEWNYCSKIVSACPPACFITEAARRISTFHNMRDLHVYMYGEVLLVSRLTPTLEDSY